VRSRRRGRRWGGSSARPYPGSPRGRPRAVGPPSRKASRQRERSATVSQSSRDTSSISSPFSTRNTALRLHSADIRRFGPGTDPSPRAFGARRGAGAVRLPVRHRQLLTLAKQAERVVLANSRPGKSSPAIEMPKGQLDRQNPCHRDFIAVTTTSD
jgi:hypothetical protein